MMVHMQKYQICLFNGNIMINIAITWRSKYYLSIISTYNSSLSLYDIYMFSPNGILCILFIGLYLIRSNVHLIMLQLYMILGIFLIYSFLLIRIIKNFNAPKHNNFSFIIFQVEVKGTGWISLALTFRGNLMGSDIIIGWVASDQSATIIVCKMINLNFQVTYTKFLDFFLFNVIFMFFFLL